VRCRELLVVFCFLLAPAAAVAHPHLWVDVASEVLFDPKGQVTAVRHHWRFDEAYSAFAAQGLDVNADGTTSRDELQALAQENVEALKEFDYFTFLFAGDYQAGFGSPYEYYLDLDEARLTLHFTLPLAQPLLTKSTMLLQVFDPNYYIAFALPSREAVRLVDAPAACRLQVTPAQGPDAAAAEALARVGPDQRELPSDLQALATGIDNSAEVNCGGPTVAAAGQAGARTAGDAVRQMAEAGPGPQVSLSELPDPGADALGAAGPADDGAQPTARAEPGLMAKVAELQTSFNRDLTRALAALKTDGWAFWWLGGVSFLYGIVHAAGPGHGKVVISSYLLANEARLRRGVAIAFVSALVQALVAIGIVGVLAILLGATSLAMTQTAGILETGSFALVAALGIYLLVGKGRQAWLAVRGAHTHDPGAIRWEEPSGTAHGRAAGHRHAHHPHPHHHHHHHGHAGSACSCGHHHHVDPAELERGGLAGVAAAVLSVGLRPCTGALVVLVFALAQGIFWAGVASTFLMALGTAITVAVLAALAVGAKDLALRLARGDGRRSAQAMLALELVAALFITGLGGALFVGSLAA